VQAFARWHTRQVCCCWPCHEQYIWNGASLADKQVLVRCYHGLGDTIQFIRFAAPLHRIARHVTVWAQAELLPLIATAPGVDRVLALHDGRAPSLFLKSYRDGNLAARSEFASIPDRPTFPFFRQMLLRGPP
jgi:hypothetical protein